MGRVGKGDKRIYGAEKWIGVGRGRGDSERWMLIYSVQG